MQAVQFSEANTIIAENQKEYTPLPAFIGPVPMYLAEGQTVPVMGATFCMKLTPTELEQVKETGCIWHTVLTFGQPLQPQSMTVEKPDWVG